MRLFIVLDKRPRTDNLFLLASRKGLDYEIHLTLLLTASAVSLSSCSTSRPILVKASGSPGTSFTARYQIGNLNGTVATVASEAPSTVFEGPSGQGHLEFEKQNAGQELIVDVYEGKHHKVHVLSPTGTRGVRATKNDSGWRAESF
jgi:hypothetical protein